MNPSIEIMKNSIVKILLDNKPSIYLFGSVVFEDFKIGWSDIDILCLTKSEIRYLYYMLHITKRYNIV